MTAPVLEVKGLKTYFFTRRGVVKAVDGVSFSVDAGEAVGIVGESGCGKSITCLSILRLVPEPAGRIVGGEVIFEDQDLLKNPESQMRQIRGKSITIILQDPLTSLNPVYTIGNQVSEPFKYHAHVDERKGIIESVVEVLNRVGIPTPKLRLKDFPHQFSGGMRQRVVAGMAIACQPRLLIADEPTTALDVTIQAQFLRLIKQLQAESNLAVIFITHDLGIVAEVCDRVLVMYAGRIVEAGDVYRIYENPAHPYTEGLMRSVPILGTKVEKLFSIDGQPPDLRNLTSGCSFQPRCKKALDICLKEYPPETSLDEGGFVRCWLRERDNRG